MSDIRDHSGPPDDELIAAEYALGVLSGTERTDAEAPPAAAAGDGSQSNA